MVYCGIHPDQLFETMQELGSTDSTFCGHDHYNNFSLNYKGINLTYGYSIDYLAYVGIYKQGTQRGCTILEYDQNGGWISTRRIIIRTSTRMTPVSPLPCRRSPPPDCRCVDAR